jgi:hypothetical protein
MTSQMQNLLARVDGMPTLISPQTILGAETPSEPQAAASPPTPTKRRIRITRQRAGVLAGRVPRAIEDLLGTEIADLEVHEGLLSAGLL